MEAVMRRAVVFFLLAALIAAIILLGGWLLLTWLVPVEPYGPPIFRAGSVEQHGMRNEELAGVPSRRNSAPASRRSS